MTVSDESSTSVPESLARLIERARAVDGQPPFSDQSLVELQRAKRTLVDSAHGAAIVSPDELELVVDPDDRGHGHGANLLGAVLREHPDVEYAWAHGDHPASRALASRFGFTPVRTLLQLRAAHDTDGRSWHSAAASANGRPGHQKSETRSTPAISPFRPGIDDRAWLAVNATAFAEHPEQGALTQSDLDDRMAEPWFDAADFLTLRDGEGLIGFCWLKIEATAGQDRLGEFYAVGIDPSRQGEGLGRVLMDAGFARLAERGIRTAVLYVEADNEPALALYRRYGFTQHTIDVRYQRAR